MDSPRSTIENESFSSFNEIFFSSSPYVFNDIENMIESLGKNINDPNKIKYNLVIKDLVIRGFEIENAKLRYNLVLKDLILRLLQKQTNKYKIMWESLYLGDGVVYVN
jgi:hypothetical protein